MSSTDRPTPERWNEEVTLGDGCQYYRDVVLASDYDALATENRELREAAEESEECLHHANDVVVKHVVRIDELDAEVSRLWGSVAYWQRVFHESRERAAELEGALRVNTQLLMDVAYNTYVEDGVAMEDVLADSSGEQTNE